MYVNPGLLFDGLVTSCSCISSGTSLQDKLVHPRAEGVEVGGFFMESDNMACPSDVHEDQGWVEVVIQLYVGLGTACALA